MGGDVGSLGSDLEFLDFRESSSDSRVQTWSKPENPTQEQIERVCSFCFHLKDSTDWVVIQPEDVGLSADKSRKYRIVTSPGSYECGVTGVCWKSTCEVELEYCWSNWDLVSEFLEREQFEPCGPLLDITVISGKLEAVHLPHFLCLGSDSLDDAVRVCHVTDDGVSLETCTLTRFHATVLHPTFSPRGAVVKKRKQLKVHCEVLIYRALRAFLTLRVYLIPKDSSMKEDVKTEESGQGVKIIKPNRSTLQMSKWYNLKTPSCRSKITPKRLQLSTTGFPYFFEVYLDNPTRDFDLQMVKEKDSRTVWEATIRKDEYKKFSDEQNNPNQEYAVWFVDTYRIALTERVSLVTPIADELRDLIGNEKYKIITNKNNTSEDNMRKLYEFLSGGQEIKMKFYESLLKKEPYLVAELIKENP